MSWMTARATLRMTETELTRRHSVRTVTHINMVWCGGLVGWFVFVSVRRGREERGGGEEEKGEMAGGVEWGLVWGGEEEGEGGGRGRSGGGGVSDTTSAHGSPSCHAQTAPKSGD